MTSIHEKKLFTVDHLQFLVATTTLTETDIRGLAAKHDDDLEKIMEAATPYIKEQTSSAMAPLPLSDDESDHEDDDTKCNSDDGDEDEIEAGAATDFYAWLATAFPKNNKGTQYKDAFLANDFYDFESLCDIADDKAEMANIGITSAAHRLKIAKKIKSLSPGISQQASQSSAPSGARYIEYNLSWIRKYSELNRREMNVYIQNACSSDSIFSRFGGPKRPKPKAAIIFLGQSGTGKSTLGNRLCGDNSPTGNGKGFKTAASVGGCTSKIKPIHVVTYLSNGTVVVDMPGFNDSHMDEEKGVVESRDSEFLDSMIEFFSTFTIGKKLFLIVKLLTNPRLHQTEIENFKLAEALFGDMVWENLAVVLTYTDRVLADDADFRIKMQNFENAAREQNKILKRIFKLKRDIPFLSVGENNYGETVTTLHRMAHEREPFDNYVIEKLARLKGGVNLYARWKAGDDLRAYIEKTFADNQELRSYGIVRRLMHKYVSPRDSSSSVRDAAPRRAPSESNASPQPSSSSSSSADSGGCVVL